MSTPQLRGTWLQSASPIVAEALALTGRFDFLVVDLEHSPADMLQVHAIAQASTVQTWVRLPFAADCPAHYLDSGATGIIAPNLQDPDTLRRLISESRYPPHGTRGLGYARSNAYGYGITAAPSAPHPTIIAQIESREALDNLDDILAVDGLDAVMLGPYDLSASLGVPGDFLSPAYLAAERQILSHARRAGLRIARHELAYDVPPDPDPDILILGVDLAVLQHHFQRRLSPAT